MGKGKKQLQEESYSMRFTIKQELGEGGNAIVYLVEDKNTTKSKALKALKNFSAEKQQRFEDEISILQRCTNEKIVGVLPIIDFDTEQYWYTMPVATRIVDSVPSKNKEAYVPAIVSMVIQLAETLEILHNKGISHRDIKPDNLYIYNERACFGDFGLVDFPDKTNNLTRNDKGLGAIFTIAPEMKRNPQDADGKKADVYSLAKTLWMLLTLDEKGFDGQYQYTDPSIQLHGYEHLAQVYLVEIERLLKQATDHDSNNRPTITEFRDTLIQWQHSYKNSNIAERNEWQFLMEAIFYGRSVKSASFVDIDEIIRVLNIIGKSPGHNHLLFGDGGGLDFNSASRANELGCIYLVNGPFWNIIKPKTLYFESFDDSRWNYFLLEAEPLQPILDNSRKFDEDLVEDTPGHYVSSEDVEYGVYDYDSGRKLPVGYKHVYRYVRGKFLIVQKTGPYNHMPRTYDGRHMVMSNEELKGYMQCLSDTLNQYLSKGWTEEQVLYREGYNKNPYQDRMEITVPKESEIDASPLPNGDTFVRGNFQSWSFIDFINELTDIGNSKLDFYFSFEGIEEHWGLISRKYWYLAQDGTIKQTSFGDIADCFIVRNRYTAIDVCNRLNEKIMHLCKGYDIENALQTFYFKIRWSRNGMPSHLFTKEEIKKEMRNADDRDGNKLVIDEDGYAHVVPFHSICGDIFPVVHAAWGAYKNYTGKYSSLATLDSTYLNSLVCWLDYLKTGDYQYCDVTKYGNEDQIIDEIKKLMENK